MHRPRAGLQLPDEKIVQARPLGFPRLVKIELREAPPDGDREIAHPRLLDAAEPAHEARERDARDAIGDEEIHVLTQPERLQ
jgi:hypothetical protein